MKRQDSKDDVRCGTKSGRRETNWTGGKEGIRIFRRDNSREDVGRESGNSNAKGKQAGKEERTEERVGVCAATKSRSTVNEQSRTRVAVDKERTDEEGPQDDRVREDPGGKVGTMLDVVVTDEILLKEQENVRKGEEREGKGFAEAEDSMLDDTETSENDKNTDSAKDTSEGFVENADTDVAALRAIERKAVTDFAYGKKSDDFQVVSKIKL